MSSMEETLQEFITTLNNMAEGQYKYSAKITTNAKGEGQIHCSVRSNESVDDTKILLDNLTQKTIEVMEGNGINFPKVK